MFFSGSIQRYTKDHNRINNFIRVDIKKSIELTLCVVVFVIFFLLSDTSLAIPHIIHYTPILAICLFFCSYCEM